MNRATTAFVALGLIWGSNFLFMKWASETITAGQITLLWVLFGFLPVLVYAAIRGAFDRLDITASSPELLRRLHLRTADAVGELSEVLITDDQEIRAARQGGRTLTFRGASEDHRRTKEGMLPIEAVILRRQLAWSRGDGPARSVALRGEKADTKASNLCRFRRYGGRKGLRSIAEPPRRRLPRLLRGHGGGT